MQIGGLMLVVFFFWTALQLYVPTLPVFVQQRTNDLALTGMVLSMSGLMGLLVRLPLGILSDWSGRCKPFVIVGMLLGGVGACLMAVGKETSALAIGRALTGLAGAAWVPMLVLFSSMFTAKESIRSMALLTVVLSLSRMMATSLTGWLNDLGGYPLAFFLSAGMAGLAILVLLPVRERNHPAQQLSVQKFGCLLRRRDVMLPSFLNIIGQYVGVLAVFTYAPILAQRMGAGNIVLSVLATWNLVWYALGNASATIFASRISRPGNLAASFIVMSAGLAVLAWAPSLAWIFAAHALYGFAGGNSYPVLMGLAVDQVLPEERSTAMGLHQTIYTLGTFAGPWLGGLLAARVGLQPMFGITACACLVLGSVGAACLAPDSTSRVIRPETNLSG